jgi:hypothetical protein
MGGIEKEHAQTISVLGFTALFPKVIAHLKEPQAFLCNRSNFATNAFDLMLAQILTKSSKKKSLILGDKVVKLLQLLLTVGKRQ